MQQHIAALDLQRLRHIGCRADGADRGARTLQRVAATQQVVQHRAAKGVGQILGA